MNAISYFFGLILKGLILVGIAIGAYKLWMCTHAYLVGYFTQVESIENVEPL